MSALTRAPAYIWRLNSLRDIDEVVDGKAMFKLPYREGEKEGLERRAHQIGGAGLKQTLVKIRSSADA